MGASWTSRIPAITAGMEPKASLAVQKTVHDIEAQAKTMAPVDTGYLRSSIQGEMTGALSGVVNAGADYAIYQEYGTRKMAAHPFMTPAAEAAAPGFHAAVRSIVS